MLRPEDFCLWVRDRRRLFLLKLTILLYHKSFCFAIPKSRFYEKFSVAPFGGYALAILKDLCKVLIIFTLERKIMLVLFFVYMV